MCCIVFYFYISRVFTTFLVMSSESDYLFPDSPELSPSYSDEYETFGEYEHEINGVNEVNCVDEKTILSCNQPEKIVLIIDRAITENISQEEDTDNTFTLLKRSITSFVYNKSKINKTTQYALVLLNKTTAKWILDFTNDVYAVLDTLNGFNSCKIGETRDLTSIFDLINSHVSLKPIDKKNSQVPPAYVVRGILFYVQSNALPILTKNERICNLLEHESFTFDILIMYDPTVNNAYYELVKEILKETNVNGNAYFFIVSRNSNNLFVAVAKLLSHPLQRPPQRIADYSINEDLK